MKTKIALILLLSSCPSVHAQDYPTDWMNALPVKPGESLEAHRNELPKNVVTLVEVSKVENSKDLWIAGSGTVSLGDGGRFFLGRVANQIPLLEITLRASQNDQDFKTCSKLINPENLSQYSVTISGQGHFKSMDGIGSRPLGVLLFDRGFSCGLTPKR